MLRKIKSLFGIYETGHEYMANVSDIHVAPEWRKTKIGYKKWQRKLNYWRKLGVFESKVIIDKNFNLIDGYSTLRIAEIKGIKKIPVYFVNKKIND